MQPLPPSTPASRLTTLLGLVAATAVLYLAKEILIPTALAVLFTFLLFPLVAWLEGRGIKRVFAVVITVVVLIGALGGFAYMLGGQFVEFVDKLPSYRKNIVTKVHTLKPGRGSVLKRAEAAFQDISREMESETTATEELTTPVLENAGTTAAAGEATDTVPRAVAEHMVYKATANAADSNAQSLEATHGDPTQDALQTVAQVGAGQSPNLTNAVPVRVVEGPPNTIQTFTDMVGPLIAVLGNAGLVILFVIFFLLQREDLRDRIIRLAGQNQVRVTTEALEEAATRVSRYLLMQLIVNVTYGIPVAIGLWFIGVPNALLWGAMATVLRFIPYAGPFIAASMPIALSLAVFDNWTMPLLTVGLFIVLELLSNNIMEPILYGHSTGVSPVAIIFSAVFWTWLWGPVGLVLSTPITVCLVVLGGYIPQMAFLRVLLGDEQVLDDDARIYNRLLSGATDEAVEVAEEFLEENELPKLFDDVLVPALERAETDRNDDMLSEERYKRFISGMEELTESVYDRVAAIKAKKDAKDLAEREKLQQERPEDETAEAEGISAEEPEPATPLPRKRIVCVPVNDKTDETAAQMLTHLLNTKDYDVLVTPSGTLASEVIRVVREFDAEIIVLSSVPPFAVAHARYLAKRLAAEFQDKTLIAGLWVGENSVEKADERLKGVGVSHIYTRISEAALHL